MVPSKKPPSIYCRKLATDRGASFSKNSILKSPSVVSKRIIGVPCVVNSLARSMNGADSNPGVAGIVGVRSNVAEAAEFEQARNIVRLRVAMLEQQPTARVQVLHGPADDAVEGFQSRRTAGERDCPLRSASPHARIMQRHIRRVRNVHVDRSVGQ